MGKLLDVDNMVHIESLWMCLYCKKQYTLQDTDQPVEEAQKNEMLTAFHARNMRVPDIHACDSSALGNTQFLGVQAIYQLPDGFKK